MSLIHPWDESNVFIHCRKVGSNVKIIQEKFHLISFHPWTLPKEKTQLSEQGKMSQNNKATFDRFVLFAIE